MSPGRCFPPKTGVQRAALRLLEAVDYWERRDSERGPDNRFAESDKVDGVAYVSVGLSYREIRDRLAERFPEARTTPACLRWYISHVRDGLFEGVELPYRRPRARHNVARTRRPR